MTKRDQSVKTYSGTPPATAFGASQGTPLVIDYTAATGYFMHPVTGAVTALGGGGGGGGGVTSVGLATPNSTLTVGGTNPVTTTGTINADINLGHQNSWTAAQNVTASTLTDASTITPNGALSNNFYLLTTSAVGASRTINLPSGTHPAGSIVNFEVVQPHTGGPCTVAWATGYKWGVGGQDGQPTGTTVADASDFYSFTVQQDGNLHGVMIGQSGPSGRGYQANSASPLTTSGSGSKIFNTQSGLAYLPGARIRATSQSTGDYMEGIVSTYSNGFLTVTMDTNSGTGTHSDWNINLAGNPGTNGTNGTNGANGAGSPTGVSGRLTLTSGVPVTTSDVTGATTVYFTPYKGNNIVLWDGAAWTGYTFAETSLALGTLTAGLPYDVFGRQVAGVLALDLLAWTNGTTRATAVTLQEGRYCKSGDKTRLYLGTFYTTSTTATEDSTLKRFLYNHYNRIERFMERKETTSQWSYTTGTIRQPNASTSNQVEFVTGIPEDQVEANLVVNVSLSGNLLRMASVGIGLDSTTAYSGLVGLAFYFPANANGQMLSAQYRGIPAAGYHKLCWLEFGADATCAWQGTGNGGQSGISAKTFA